MTRYKVGTLVTKEGPEYFVKDTKEDVRIHGSFDTERVAQIFADFLNERDKHEENSLRKVGGEDPEGRA